MRGGTKITDLGINNTFNFWIFSKARAQADFI